MVDIPKPSAASSISALAEALDAATHEERVAWVRSLGRSEQYRLYALAEGRPVTLEELVAETGRVVRHFGKNGLALFNRFEKRFVRLSDGTVGGYNENDFGLLSSVVKWVTGPGHFLARVHEEVPAEVLIDYRTLPAVHHPEFPPLADNESGLPALVFGDMVDVVRRVSRHVTIGDAFKGRFPRSAARGLLCWFGATFLPTAPFVMCREP